VLCHTYVGQGSSTHPLGGSIETRARIMRPKNETEKTKSGRIKKTGSGPSISKADTEWLEFTPETKRNGCLRDAGHVDETTSRKKTLPKNATRTLECVGGGGNETRVLACRSCIVARRPVETILL